MGTVCFLLLSILIMDGTPEKSGTDPEMPAVSKRLLWRCLDQPNLSVRLEIEATGSFKYSIQGCFSYRSMTGKVRVEGDSIRLIPDPSAPGDGRIQGVSLDFVRIPWGERSFLIAKGDEMRFCNAVNQGRVQSVYLGEFLRDGGARIPAPLSGLPAVPPSWRPFLLESPLRAKVVESLGEGRVSIDLRGGRGAFEGMEFFLQDGSEFPLKVVEVSGDRCVATFQPYPTRKELPGGLVLTTWKDHWEYR